VVLMVAIHLVAVRSRLVADSLGAQQCCPYNTKSMDVIIINSQSSSHLDVIRASVSMEP